MAPNAIDEDSRPPQVASPIAKKKSPFRSLRSANRARIRALYGPSGDVRSIRPTCQLCTYFAQLGKQAERRDSRCGPPHRSRDRRTIQTAICVIPVSSISQDFRIAFPILGAPIGEVRGPHRPNEDRPRTTRPHAPEDIDTDGHKRATPTFARPRLTPPFEFLGDALGAELESAEASHSDLHVLVGLPGFKPGASWVLPGLTAPNLVGATYGDTTCPDGRNSDQNAGSCANS
jgi:hypothetical protein